ncbi:hypothetical protein MHU86_8158 [Fragilaria crotonensis]|nr:hypothetical protein MHU86_8158 [Fragilaria crotonensis]
MKSWVVYLCLMTLAVTRLSSGFVPGAQSSRRSMTTMAAFVTPPPVQHLHQIPQTSFNQHSSPLTLGIKEFNAGSSQVLSLQERRPPTKEEIEEKKRNFNFWFWGGGFVAPFLATFYYFGFKFWER